MGNLLTATGLSLDSAPNQAYQCWVNLINENYISGKSIVQNYVQNKNGSNVIRIDPTWYMADGLGKYFAPEMISDNAILSLKTQSAGIYNLTDILTLSERTGSISNYTTDMGSSDYFARSFLFGGSSFRITSGTVTSDGNGNLTFSNVVIKPMDDDFDFDFSFKGGAAFPFFEGIGLLLSRKIDPTGAALHA